jgi:hypothetical protein
VLILFIVSKIDLSFTNKNIPSKLPNILAMEKLPADKSNISEILVSHYLDSISKMVSRENSRFRNYPIFPMVLSKIKKTKKFFIDKTFIKRLFREIFFKKVKKIFFSRNRLSLNYSKMKTELGEKKRKNKMENFFKLKINKTFPFELLKFFFKKTIIFNAF